MTQKTHDVAVKLGEYTDREGNAKGRWKNVGSVLKFDDGGTGILLDRTFNPAGVPNPDGRDTVLLSVFPVKPRDGQAPAYQATQQPSPTQQMQAPAQPDPNDEIPF